MKTATTAMEDAWAELRIKDYIILEWYNKTKDVATMDFKTLDRTFENQQTGFYYDNNNEQETEYDYNNDNTNYESEYGYSDDNDMIVHNHKWNSNNDFLPTIDQFCSPKYGGCGKQSGNYWHLVDCPRLERDQNLKTETIAYDKNDTIQNRNIVAAQTSTTTDNDSTL